MKKTLVVALSLGITSWAQANQPASLVTGAPAGIAAIEQGQYLPGEFVVTFQPGANAQPRTEAGIVVTGVRAVDELNARFGVYSAVEGSLPGTFRFKVPAGADIREVVAAYRALTQPVKAASGILASDRLGNRETADAALVQPKQAVGGVVLAAAVLNNSGALFEGPRAQGGLIQPLVLRQEGPAAPNLLQRVACNPNVEDCPAAPSRPPARSSCNPAVEDCPSTPSTRPTTPPVRRPGEVTCTPGVDPGCGGAPVDTRPPAPTRPPANWSRRPTSPPSSWTQPGSSVEYLRTAPSGWWYPVGGAWFPVEATGSFGSYTTGSATIERGGKDTGKGQESEYQRTIKSSAHADKYRLHYSRVGINCVDYDNERYCEHWGTDYRWIYVDTISRSREVTVDVKFTERQELLPWETESFTFYFDGNSNTVSSRVDGGNTWNYAYRVEGPVQNFSNGHVAFAIQPGPKKQTSADPNAVSVGLEIKGGSVLLIVHDKRASFYKGEPLDVAVKVIRRVSCKNGSWWHDLNCSDTVTTAFESRQNDQPNPRLRMIIPANLSLQANEAYAGPVAASCNPNVEDCAAGINLGSGNGKYTIESSWGGSGSFRRVGSAISRPDWHNVAVERGRQEVAK